MANEPDYERFLRILRGLQTGQTELKQAIANLSQRVLAIRNQLHTIHGDGLRQEHLIAGLRADVDRIKARLEIADRTDA